MLVILIFGVYLAWSIARPAYLAAKGRRLVKSKNVAVAQLENQHARGESFAKAAITFARFSRELPDERLGPRNLAVCRLLAFQSLNKRARQEDRQTRDKAAAAAQESIDDLIKAHNSHVAHWLAAQLQQGLNETATDSKHEAAAIASLSQAAKLAPQNPVYWYGLFRLQSVARDADERKKAADSLRRAYRLDKENLQLLVDWLVVQAGNQDTAITETLNHAREVLAPVKAGIQLQTNTDVTKLTEQVLAEVQAGDWTTAEKLTREIQDVVSGEPTAKTDLAKLTPHPIEFVIRDFSDDFYSKFRPAKLKPAEPIKVTFRSQPKLNLENLQDVRDVVLTDFDLDNRLDLLVLTGMELQVLEQATGEKGWEPVIQFPVAGNFQGILVADLDRDEHHRLAGNQTQQAQGPERTAVSDKAAAGIDSDGDVVLFGADGIVVLRNDLDPATGTAELVRQSQSDEIRRIKRVLTAILVDVEQDGELDLLLSSESAIHVLRNLGDRSLRFEDASKWSILPEQQSFTSLVAVNWDHDADIDLLAGSPESGAIGVLENSRHGHFQFRELDRKFFGGTATPSIEVLESDGNQSWDIVAAGKAGLRLAQTSNPRPGVVQLIGSKDIGKQQLSGVTVFDYDNDSFVDLLAWGHHGLRIYRGTVNAGFEATDFKFASLKDIQVCRVADLDNDGDLDVVVALKGGVSIFDNQGGNKNHWIQLRIKGNPDSHARANSYGIGSLVELRAGPQYQAQVVRGQRTHFGLGKHLKPDVLRMVWTNGVPQNIITPQPDTVYCQQMLLKGP